MKGNFSRLSRAGVPADFSRVLLQQGRVLLDSDWNALVQLFEDEVRRRTRLIVGDTGYPLHEGGYELTFKGGVELNGGGPEDGQYGQAITVRRRASLPFRESGIDQPYSLRLELVLPASDFCGRAPRAVLLSVPGRFSIEVEPDRCLLVYGPDRHAGPWLRLGPMAPLRPQFVHVSWDGSRHLAFWTSSTAAGVPERCEEVDVNERLHATGAPSRTALSIGASHLGDSHLRFTFAELCVWDARLEPGRRPEQVTRESSACRLVCRLDTAAIHPKREPPGAVIVDASGSGNDGFIWRTRAEQALPPVRLLEAGIGAGDYLLRGVNAHNPAPTGFEHQPWSRERLPERLSTDETAYLFYLEAWERFVSALQYPALVEPALGGPDTTARTQLVWQVRAITAPSLAEAQRRFESRAARYHSPGLARFWRPEHASGQAGNQLYRVEVHDPGWTLHDHSVPHASSHVRIERVTSRTVRVEDPDIAELLAPHAPVALLHGERDPFVTHVTAALGGARFDLARLPDELTTELRLLPLATFKWSKENGAVAFPVRSVEPAHRAQGEAGTSFRFYLENAGYNGFELRVGDYLELIDDAQDLARRGGSFFRLTALDETQLTLSVESSHPLPHVELGASPVLRRWSGKEGRAGLVGPLRPVDGSQLLEHEIYVEFDGAGFYAGAAWWVVAVRDDVGDGLLWPGERCLPPQGIEVHACELASLELGHGLAVARDLRTPFRSLTDLTQSGRPARESQRPEGSALLDKLLSQVWGGRACVLVDGPADLPGLERTGIRVEGRSLRSESWQLVDTQEPPRGPGVAVLWQHRPTFIGEASARLDERGAWQSLPALDRRLDFAACTHGSRLLVIGGREAGLRDGKPLSSIMLLEEPASAWRELEPREKWTPTFGLTAVEWQGKIHLLGGATAEGVQKTHRIFDPQTGTFARAADLVTARKNFAALVHDDLLYVIGGCDADERYLATVECWDRASDTWRLVPPLDEGAGPPATADLTAVSVREGIVVVGGFDGAAKSEAWLLLPALRRWQALAPLGFARSRHGLLATSAWREPDRPAVYAIGGVEERRSVPQVEVLFLTRGYEVMRPSRPREES